MVSNFLSLNVSAFRKTNLNIKTSYESTEHIDYNAIYDNNSDLSDFEMIATSQDAQLDIFQDENSSIKISHNYLENSYVETQKYINNEFMTTITQHFSNNVLQTSNFHKLNSNTGSYSNITSYVSSNSNVFEYGDGLTKQIYITEFRNTDLVQKNFLYVLDNVQMTIQSNIEQNSITEYHKYIYTYDNYGFVKDIREKPFDLKKVIEKEYNFENNTEFLNIKSYDDKTITLAQKNILSIDTDIHGFVYPTSYSNYPHTLKMYETFQYDFYTEKHVQSNYDEKTVNVVHKMFDTLDEYGFPVSYCNLHMLYSKNTKIVDNVEITTELQYDLKHKLIKHKKIHTFDDFGMTLTYEEIPNDLIFVQSTNIDYDIEITIESNITTKQIKKQNKSVFQLDEYGFPLSYTDSPILYLKEINISDFEHVVERFFTSKKVKEAKNVVLSSNVYGFPQTSSNIFSKTSEIKDALHIISESNYDTKTFSYYEKYIDTFDENGFVSNYSFPDMKYLKQLEFVNDIKKIHTVDYDNLRQQIHHYSNDIELIYDNLITVNNNIEFFTESNYTNPDKIMYNYFEREIEANEYGFMSNYIQSKIEFKYKYSNYFASSEEKDFSTKFIKKYNYFYDNNDNVASIHSNEWKNIIYISDLTVLEKLEDTFQETFIIPRHASKDYHVIEIKKSLIDSLDSDGFVASLSFPPKSLTKKISYSDQILHEELKLSGFELSNVEIETHYNYSSNNKTIIYRQIDSINFNSNSFHENTIVAYPNDLLYEKHITVNTIQKKENTIEKNYLNNSILEYVKMYDTSFEVLNSSNFGFVEHYVELPNEQIVYKTIDANLMYETETFSNFQSNMITITTNKIDSLDDYGFVLNYDNTNKLVKQSYKNMNYTSNFQVFVESNLYEKTIMEEHRHIIDYDGYGFPSLLGSNLYLKNLEVKDTNQHSEEKFFLPNSNITITQDKDITSYDNFGFAKTFSNKLHVVNEINTTYNNKPYVKETIQTYDINDREIYFYEYILENDETQIIEQTLNDQDVLKNTLKNFDGTTVITETDDDYQSIKTFNIGGLLVSEFENITNNDNTITEIEKISDSEQIILVYDTSTTPRSLLNKIHKHINDDTTIEEYYNINNDLIYTKTINPNTLIYPYTEKTRYEEQIDDVKEIIVHFASINEYTTTKLNSNGDRIESVRTVFRDIDGKTQDIIETYGNIEVSIGTGEMIEHLQCVGTIDDYVEYKEYWYDHTVSSAIDTFYNLEDAKLNCALNSNCKYISKIPDDWRSRTWMYGEKYILLSNYLKKIENKTVWENEHQFVVYNKLCVDDRVELQWRVINTVDTEWYYNPNISVIEYDANQQLTFIKEINEDTTIERFIVEDYVLVIHPNTNRFPFTKKIIYGENKVIDDVKIRYEEHRASDIVRLTNYNLIGNKIVNEYDSSLSLVFQLEKISELSKIERYYNDAILSYSKQTTYEIYNEYPMTEIFIYYHDKIENDVKKRILNYIHPTSTIEEEYDINDLIMHKSEITNSQQTDTFYIEGVEEYTFRKIFLSNQKYYEIITYADEFIQNNIKIIQKLFSDEGILAEEYHYSPNMILLYEKIIESIDTIETHYNDNEQIIQKITTSPNTNTYPYVQTFVYSNELLQYGVKTKIVTYKSVSEIIYEYFNTNGNRLHNIYDDDDDSILIEQREMDGFNTIIRRYENGVEISMNIIYRTSEEYYPYTEFTVYESDEIVDNVKILKQTFLSTSYIEVETLNSKGNVINNVYENDLLYSQEEFIIRSSIRQLTIYAYELDNRVIKSVSQLIPYTNLITNIETIIYEDEYIENQIKRIVIDTIDSEKNKIIIKHFDINKFVIYSKDIDGTTDFETFYLTLSDKYEKLSEPNTGLFPKTETYTYYGTFIVDFVKKRIVSITSTGQTSILFNINLYEIENVYDNDNLIISTEFNSDLKTTTERHFDYIEGIRTLKKTSTIYPNNTPNTYGEIILYEDNFITDNIKKILIETIDKNNNIINITHQGINLELLYTNSINGLVDTESFYINGPLARIITTEPNTRTPTYTEIIEYFNTYIVDFVKWIEITYSEVSNTTKLYNANHEEIENEYYHPSGNLQIHRIIIGTTSTEDHYTEQRQVFMVRTVIPNNNVLDYTHYDIYKHGFIEESVKKRNTFYEQGVVKYVHHYNVIGTRFYELEIDNDTDIENFLLNNYTKITVPNSRLFEYKETFVYYEGAIQNSIKQLEILYKNEYNRIEKYFDINDFLMYEKDIDTNNEITNEIIYYEDGSVWFNQKIEPNTLELPYVIEIVYADARIINNVKKMLKFYNIDGTISTERYTPEGNLINNVYDADNPNLLVYSIVYIDNSRVETYYESDTEYRTVTTTNSGQIPYTATTVFTSGLIVDDVKKIVTTYTTDGGAATTTYNEYENIIQNVYDTLNPSLLIEQTEFDGIKTFVRTWIENGLSKVKTIEPNDNQEQYLEITLYEDIGIENDVTKMQVEYVSVSNNIINITEFNENNLLYEKNTIGLVDTEYFYNHNTYNLKYVIVSDPNNAFPYTETKTFFGGLIIDNVKKTITTFNDQFSSNVLKYNENDNLIENIYHEDFVSLLIQQTEYEDNRTYIRTFNEYGLVKTKTIDPNDNAEQYTETTLYEEIGIVNDVSRLIVEYQSVLNNIVIIQEWKETNLLYENNKNGLRDFESFYNHSTFVLEYTVETLPNTKIIPYVETTTFYGYTIIDNVKVRKQYYDTNPETELFNELGNKIENIYESDLLVLQREIVGIDTYERNYIYIENARTLTHTLTITPNNDLVSYNEVNVYEASYVVDDIKMMITEHIEHPNIFNIKYYTSENLESIFYEKKVDYLLDTEFFYDRSNPEYVISHVKTTTPNTKEFPYTETITYEDGYIITTIKVKEYVYNSTVDILETLYNSSGNTIEVATTSNGDISIYTEFFETDLRKEETYYDVGNVIMYIRTIVPYTDTNDYKETIMYEEPYVVDNKFVIENIYQSGNLYNIRFFDGLYFKFYDKIINDQTETETFYTTEVDYYIKITEENQLTYIYVGSHVLNDIFKKIIITNGNEVEESFYDDSDQIFYRTLTTINSLTESFYDDLSVLEFTKQTIPSSRIIPYEERFVYYNHMIVDDVVQKIIHYVSTDVIRTDKYIVGDVKINSFEVNSATSTSIEIVYANAIEQYRTTITPINVDFGYTSIRTYAQSYIDERVSRNVKTVEIFYVDTLSNIDESLYDDANVIIYLRNVRNTTTTETYYNVNGVIQYVSTLSPNTNIYPFAKTIVYETDFIVDDVKTVIESYVSSFITNIVNYNESGNIIENIYENEVLIQQTEYTELTTIDRHYVDGVLVYEKTTLPKEKTFPYTETLIYTDAFVVDDVRTDIKTYNSETNIITTLYNTAGNIIENIYNDETPAELIEQKEYIDTTTTICKYYTNGILEYTKTTTPNDGSYPYVETIEYTEPQTYNSDNLQKIIITYNSETEYITEKYNNEDTLYEQITSIIREDGMQQDTTSRWEYVTTSQAGTVYGGQCVSSSYQRINYVILYFNGSQNLGSFSSFSSVNASCNSDSRCAHITRHPGSSSSIIYYKLSGYTSQQPYGIWGGKYYAFAMNKICQVNETVITWTQVMDNVVSEWY
jgi:hypothetical protein